MSALWLEPPLYVPSPHVDFVDSSLLETPNIRKACRTCFGQLPAVQSLCESPRSLGLATGKIGNNLLFPNDQPREQTRISSQHHKQWLNGRPGAKYARNRSYYQIGHEFSTSFSSHRQRHS